MSRTQISQDTLAALEMGAVPTNRFTRRALGSGQGKREQRKEKERRQQEKAATQPVDIYESLGYCLSLFSAHAVEYQICGKPVVAMTGEHAYQASKFTDWRRINQVLHALSPEEAKEVAHRHRGEYRKDWSPAVKLALYEGIARAKAQQHEVVRDHLKRTGLRKIIEGAPDNDFWGTGPDGHGRNHAGKIWMKIRNDLFSASR